MPEINLVRIIRQLLSYNVVVAEQSLARYTSSFLIFGNTFLSHCRQCFSLFSEDSIDYKIVKSQIFTISLSQITDEIIICHNVNYYFLEGKFYY